MATRERRARSRQTCELRAILSVRDGRRQFDAGACTRDISPVGAFLQSAFILKVGTVLDIALEIPGLDEKYRTGATVIRQQAPAIRDCGYSIPGNVGFAVQFHEPIEGPAAAALESHAAKQHKRAKAPAVKTTKKATKKAAKKASKTPTKRTAKKPAKTTRKKKTKPAR